MSGSEKSDAEAMAPAAHASTLLNADRPDSENSPQRALADGLLSLLLPAARQLDASADAVAQSQLTLIEEIDKLNAELDAFYDGQKIPADYEPQLMKLASLRQRVTNINSQLAATQERVNRISAGLAGESKKWGWNFGF